MHLDELLAERGVSMREVARRDGPPVSTLRRWQRGECVPRRAAITRLAQALGADVDIVSSAVLGTVATARRKARQRG